MTDAAKPVPTLPLMNAAFVLAGLATFLLGPILPLLIAQWHLSDQQAGFLLLAQFTGATLGGALVSSHLFRGFLSGTLIAAIGFFGFASTGPLFSACTSLFLAGFGVGTVIASVNILAGSRYTQHRGSALSRLNLSFSAGCLLSPILASILPRAHAPVLLAWILCALFLAVFLLLLPQLRRAAPGSDDPPAATPIFTSTFFLFAAILFFYGGLETCLSGWLTTYALRYGTSSLILSQYTLVLLLCGLTAGRALAAWLLKRLPEATLLRIALVLTIGLAGALALARNAILLTAEAVILGVCLAPIFPAAFALYLARKPTSRQGGLVLAASGLGAAAIPGLMGVVSTQAHSLRLALTLPVAAALTLLALSAFAAARPASA